MNKEDHVVIAVNGLGDNIPWKLASQERPISRLARYGVRSVFHRFFWHNGVELDSQTESLSAIIRIARKKYHKVSLIGISAGGSAVLNAYKMGPNNVHKVVTICSRLRRGTEDGFIGFTRRSKSSPAYRQSVSQWEKEEPHLLDRYRNRVMTIRAERDDQLVPADTATMYGAINTTVPVRGHFLSIRHTLSNPQRIIKFITS